MKDAKGGEGGVKEEQRPTAAAGKKEGGKGAGVCACVFLYWTCCLVMCHV